MTEEVRRSMDMAESPNLAHLVVVTMEEFGDKLKLLNYEQDFCRKLHFKPLTRHYFALPTNPGEQFHYFVNISVWMLKKCGKSLEQPGEADDPNATIATIVDVAKQLSISVDFAPSKLKSGCGVHVCNLLNNIADVSLRATRFNFKRAVIHEQVTQDEVLGDDNNELRISRMDDDILEENAADSDDGLDEGGSFLDFTNKGKQKQKSQSGEVGDVLRPSVDATAWQMEVERVLPHLKVTIRNDHRDWRSHYEQIHQHKDNIERLLTNNKEQLNKLSTDISKTVEKIGSREKYINSQLEHQIEEFRSAQNRFAEERDHYKQGSSTVNELTQQLQQITEELDSVKAQMDEKGTSMTDAGPLVKIKQSLTKLKAECTQMELFIGVVEHTLLAAKLKSKSAIHLRMNASAPDSHFAAL